jgi:2-keto-3-deoxy-L-rhamnonate aldolase RhmA
MRAVGGSVDAEYGVVDREEYYEHANRETVVIALIEDKEAVDSVDEIAATEGIDILFVGPGDLSQSYGVRGQIDHEVIHRAIDATAAACERHGKSWGTPASSPEHLAELVGRGARFLEYGTDQSVLISGFQQIKGFIDGIEVRRPS